ncbi:hypothetical protein L4C36_18310 [Photobacterium japonica]|uniref:hypothetical protein n=1 Tax=Photobacterium japonica TaxID=2910235 RepID=UPI003D10AB9A
MFTFSQHNTLTLAALIGTLTLTGCQSSTKTAAQSPLLTNTKSHIGWIAGQCFAVNNATLSAGDTIHLIDMRTHQPQRATVISKDSPQCQALASQQQAASDQSQHVFYQLDRQADAATAIGMVSDPTALASYQYQSCKLRNGEFFYITTPQGTLFWNDAYYAGQNAIPTCSSDLFR